MTIVSCWSSMSACQRNSKSLHCPSGLQMAAPPSVSGAITGKGRGPRWPRFHMILRGAIFRSKHHSGRFQIIMQGAILSSNQETTQLSSQNCEMHTSFTIRRNTQGKPCSIRHHITRCESCNEQLFPVRFSAFCGEKRSQTPHPNTNRKAKNVTQKVVSDFLYLKDSCWKTGSSLKTRF